MFQRAYFIAICGFLIVTYTSPIQASILVTEFFNGRVERFDEQTKAETTFATIAGNPGLSGIAYSASSNRVYVSALNHGGVYTLDAQSGSILGFKSLGIGPGGIAVSSNGNVYVTDFTSSKVQIFDASLANSIGTITVPAGPTSGIGFANNGNALIATAGSGVYRFDGSNVSTFTTSPVAPLASAQIAVDAANNVYIGHGLGFSDSVFKFDANGNLLGQITVTDAMVGGTGAGSSAGTSPSGLALDQNGNLIVAVLGRSNPSDAGGERGGLFKFDVNGNLLDTFASASRAYSGVAVITAVPEPSSLIILGVGALTSSVMIMRRKRHPSRLEAD